jgi:hypothetical protein
MSVDLDLIIKGYQIYIASDFHDIFRLSFPFAEIFDMGKRGMWKNESEMQKFLKRENSRIIAFYMLNNLYRKPILMLPSYLREANDFFIKLSKNVTKFIKFEDKEKAQEFQNEYTMKFKRAKHNNDYKELIAYVDKKAPELIFYFHRGFTDGVKKFFSLLKKDITPNPSKLFDPRDANFSKYIRKYYSINNEIAEFYPDRLKDLETKVHVSRPLDLKGIQNKRDSEAIYYIERLNEIFKIEKKLFIFLSSAPHMKIYAEKNKERIYKDIDGMNFLMIRNENYFYSALLEMSSVIESKMEKVKLDEITNTDLSKTLQNDLNRLQQFLDIDKIHQIGPLLKEELYNQHLKNVFDISNKLINLDLALVIDDFLPKDCDVSKFSKNTCEVYDDKLVDSFKSIYDAYQKEEFTSELFSRNGELEKKRISTFWLLGLGNIDIYHKRAEEEIALFNFPFRLNIKDTSSYEIIKEILEFIKSIKILIKKNRNPIINDESVIYLYDLLQKLSNRSNEVKSDEKFVLRQMIYLSLGENDLLDSWHNSFYNWIHDEETKRELAYIYTINFIRRMRKIEIPNKSMFKQMMELSQAFAEIEMDSIQSNLKFEEIPNNIINLKTKNKTLSKIRSERLIPFEDGFYVLEGSFNGFKKLVILKPNGSTISLKLLDFRFIHLKSVIMNRYLMVNGPHDFNDIDKIIKIFESIYMPIVKLADMEYKTAILADYSFLLSLNTEDCNYLENLKTAEKIMLDLEKEAKSPYWSYSKYFILGYIYMKMIGLVEKRYQQDLASKSRVYYTMASDEISPSADYLRQMIAKNLMILDKI